MSSESTDHETNSVEVGEEPVVDQPASSITIEGEIVNDVQVNRNMPEGGSSIMRAIFGGAVVVTDELNEWASKSDEGELSQEMVEAALQRAMERQERMEGRKFANMRYGIIGLLGEALDRTQGGTGRISKFTGRASRTAGKVIGPVWNSFLMAPVRKPVRRVEKAGEEKVDEWITRGHVEEVRSRALVEVGINDFVDNSVSELAENEQIKMIVQEVIDSQSSGIVSEIIRQARGRILSLDLLLLGKLRREQIAAPDFRDAYVRAMMEKRPQYQQIDLNSSMAGTYAGPLARLLSFIIDLLILIFIAGLFSSFISSTLALFDLRENMLSFLRSGSPLAMIMMIFIVLIPFLVIAVYFIVSWYLIGSTPGDFFFGIRVVSTEGQYVSFWHSFLRLIGMIISSIFLFFGFIWALFDHRRQGWHDKIGGTFVLYDWPAEPVEASLLEQVDASFRNM